MLRGFNDLTYVLIAIVKKELHLDASPYTFLQILVTTQVPLTDLLLR